MDFPYKATVTITTFNRKKMLKSLLSRFEEQQGDFSDRFEVIVADDGSTDGTGKFVESQMKKKALRYPLSYLNTGLTKVFGAGMARNLGIKKAQGEYLLFIDDDCVPHNRWVERNVMAMEKGEKVIIGYSSNLERKLKEDPPIKIEEEGWKRLYDQSRNDSLSELISASFAISRSCIERAGMFDERFCRKEGYGYEDIEFGHRLMIAGYRIHLVPDALVYTPWKSTEELSKKEEMFRKSKLTWWHVITHPQKDLPITPLLLQYAQKMKKELKELQDKK